MTNTEIVNMTFQVISRRIKQNEIKLLQLGKMTGIPAKKLGQMLRGNQYMRFDEYVRICSALKIGPTVPLSVAIAQLMAKERRSTNEQDQ